MKLLRRGDTTPMAGVVREMLEHIGYATSKYSKHPNDVDVYLEAAIRMFQRAQGLTIDGIVGPRTYKELKNADQLEAELEVMPVLLKDVPYYPQRDNVYKPSGTCNVTSLAMVLAYWGVKPKSPGVQLEDELFEELQTKEARTYYSINFSWAKKQGLNPRNVHGMLVWLAEKYGFVDEFQLNEPIDLIEARLASGVPQIVTGAFTASGHIVVLVGLTGSGDFVFHDPWGNWELGYRSHTNGKFVIYNREDTLAILKPLDNPKKKWMHHIVPSYDGPYADSFHRS